MYQNEIKMNMTKMDNIISHQNELIEKLTQSTNDQNETIKNHCEDSDKPDKLADDMIGLAAMFEKMNNNVKPSVTIAKVKNINTGHVKIILEKSCGWCQYCRYIV